MAMQIDNFKFGVQKCVLAFLAIVLCGELAGLWGPAAAGPGGGRAVAAVPRSFVPHRMVMPSQLINQANEDAQRYQAVPAQSGRDVAADAPGGVAMAGRSAAMGRVLDTLPDGAVALAIGGATYYMAGGIYYRPIYQGDTVVYQMVEDPH
jgi:hypothetical protein